MLILFSLYQFNIILIINNYTVLNYFVQHHNRDVTNIAIEYSLIEIAVLVIIIVPYLFIWVIIKDIIPNRVGKIIIPGIIEIFTSWLLTRKSIIVDILLNLFPPSYQGPNSELIDAIFMNMIFLLVLSYVIAFILCLHSVFKSTYSKVINDLDDFELIQIIEQNDNQL